MNLNSIKGIIEKTLISKADKENLIISEISKNEDIISIILKMLNFERVRKNELVSSMNLLLSKADIGLKSPNLNGDSFIQKEISEFYNTSKMNHCFKNVTDKQVLPIATFHNVEECETESIKFTKDNLKVVGGLLSEDYKTGYKEGIEHYLQKHNNNLVFIRFNKLT